MMFETSKHVLKTEKCCCVFKNDFTLILISFFQLDHEISTAVPGISQTFHPSENFKERVKLFEIVDSNIPNSDVAPSVHLQPYDWRLPLVPCSFGYLLHLFPFSGCVFTSNVLWKRSFEAAEKCFTTHEKVGLCVYSTLYIKCYLICHFSWIGRCIFFYHDLQQKYHNYTHLLPFMF